MTDYRYYIGGEFKKSDQPRDVVNPVTEEVFAHIFEATAHDVAAALDSARKAQDQWRKLSFKERAKGLRDIARVIVDNLAILAELESKEMGKTHKEALFVDIPLGADCFNYYASFLESLEEETFPSDLGLDRLVYDPFGVVGVYLPYNVPLMLFGFSCAAALAAGNALIVKPSIEGSISLLELAKHIDTLDLPKGLINIVTGAGRTVGGYLAQSQVDVISFTGSRDTLKKIVAETAQTPKKLVCELGGCNLTIVAADANKEDALQNILGSSFMKQGQMCIGTSVVLIEEGMYDFFVKELVIRTKQIAVGDPFDPMVGMGPLPTKKHRDQVAARVDALVKGGAQVLCGGAPLEGKGYYYPPTIVAVKGVLYEEFFAPVILVKSFKAAELCEIIDQNPTGLVMQIWTQDLVAAQRIAQETACGTIWINSFAQMSAQTPFGGAKFSGWGRNLGKHGFFEYVQPKHIGIAFGKSPVDGWFGL